MQLDQCMPNVSERFPDMREEKRKNEKIGIGPCFPLAWGFCKFYANAGEKQLTQRQLLLVQYKQQANPPLSTCPSRETVPLKDYGNIIPVSTNHCSYNAWSL